MEEAIKELDDYVKILADEPFDVTLVLIRFKLGKLAMLYGIRPETILQEYMNRKGV